MEVRSLQCPELLSVDLPSIDLPGLCSEMLGVAEEAFKAGNFELAAEIYGSQLDELPQPARFLYLKKGDALALAGRVTDALDSYTKAAMLGQLCPDEVGVLVESIAKNIREKELKLPIGKIKSDLSYRSGQSQGAQAPCSLSPPQNPNASLEIKLFSCSLCQLLLLDPVSLICGHTFCKRCLCDKRTPQCQTCNRAQGGHEAPCMDLKVNVVLGNLLEKWLCEDTKVRRLSAEGDCLLVNGNFLDALEKFNTALELGKWPAKILATKVGYSLK